MLHSLTPNLTLLCTCCFHYYTNFHLVFIVSKVPGLAAAGGAAGRVAAGPPAAPLPTLLLPPPPRRMLSSSSSVRALLRRILKKRASRLHMTVPLKLGTPQPNNLWKHGVISAGRLMVSGNLPPQCKANECYPKVTLGTPLLSHAACLNERAV